MSIIGTEFVAEVVIGGITAVASHVGVNVIVESAVQNVDLTQVGKACVWLAKTAAGSMVADHAYEMVTRRKFKDDVLTIVKDIREKNNKEETTESSSVQLEGAQA